MRIPGIAFVAAACLLGLLGACGGSCNAKGGGVLLVSRPQGLAEHRLSDHSERLLTAGQGGTLLDPAFSPDGTRLAYVEQPEPHSTPQGYDAGSDLWVARADGSKAELLFAHTQPSTIIRYPQWVDDRTLLTSVIETEQQGGQTLFSYVIERFDVGGGERQRVIDGGLTLGLSPDRTHIAYSHVEQRGESLHVAAVDGSDDVTILPIQAGLVGIGSPQFTPDGTQIAFGAADATRVERPRAGNAAPAPHGPPQDLYLIDAAGGEPRLLVNLVEDEPALVWDSGAEHLYALGGGALYDVSTKSGLVLRIGAGFVCGGIAWLPPGG